MTISDQDVSSLLFRHCCFVAAVSSWVHCVASHVIAGILRRQPFCRKYTSSPAVSSRGHFVACRFITGHFVSRARRRKWSSPALEDNMTTSVETVPVHCICSVSYNYKSIIIICSKFIYNLYILVLYLYIHLYIN